jgi:hypothetical protein
LNYGILKLETNKGDTLELIKLELWKKCSTFFDLKPNQSNATTDLKWLKCFQSRLY